MKNNTKKKELSFEERFPKFRLHKHHEFTREFLEDRYGSLVIDIIDESHTKDWIDIINNYNEEFFTQNFEKVPEGLNFKISLHFFQYFFNWDKKGYKVENFHGNWLDVPFPNVTHIKHFMDRDNRDMITLPKMCNWYELFIFMDEIMWNSGRVLDIGITSLSLSKDNDKVLEFCVSS